MTINEMNDVIQQFCRQSVDKCGRCLIQGLCEECGGNFESDNTACETAYKIITMQNSTSDAVNHPSHYNQGKFECIDVMVETFGEEAAKNFCILNAFKYIWRTGEKNGAEDVKKAIWYLDKFLELEGE